MQQVFKSVKKRCGGLKLTTRRSVEKLKLFVQRFKPYDRKNNGYRRRNAVRNRRRPQHAFHPKINRKHTN